MGRSSAVLRLAGSLKLLAPVPARAFLLGLTSTAFLTSRYSFIFVALTLGANVLESIRHNLFSPAALPITLCLLAAVFVRRRVYARLTRDSHNTELERLHSRYTTLTTAIIAVQTASVMASALGLYPWDIASRWSAYLVMLSALAVVVMAAEARSLVLARLRHRVDAVFLERRLRVLGTGVSALVVIAGSSQAMLHRQIVEGPYRTNVALQIDRLPRASLHEHSVFVAHYEVPIVRYLYEYGPYRGRPEYPRIFRFETGPEWHGKMPISARAEGIAYIVSALPLADAQARFSGVTLRPVGSRLLAVSTAVGDSSRPLTRE